MGNIDSLTELANTLDIFFKGLSECNLLSTYSVQLQASTVDYSVQVKFQLLVSQFVKNLQGLLRNIPLSSGPLWFKDAATQTNIDSDEEVNVTCATEESDLSLVTNASALEPTSLDETNVENVKTLTEMETKFTHSTEIIVTCDPESLAVIVGHDFVTKETAVKTDTNESLPILDECPQKGHIVEEIPKTSTDDIPDFLHVVVASADSDDANLQSAIFICETCDKTFSSARTLEQHLSLKHRNKGQCDMCSQRFSSVQSLQEHCRIEHGGSGCFTCPLCKRRLMTRLSYRRHMDTHNGNKGAVCDVCGKMFCRADYLRKHYMVHSGVRPHACQRCPRRFVNTSQLKVHERMHTGVKEHICDTCNKAFSRMDKLKDHMLRHLNIKRFNCTMCHKGYAEKRDLTKHIKVHNSNTS